MFTGCFTFFLAFLATQISGKDSSVVRIPVLLSDMDKMGRTFVWDSNTSFFGLHTAAAEFSFRYTVKPAFTRILIDNAEVNLASHGINPKREESASRVRDYQVIPAEGEISSDPINAVKLTFGSQEIVVKEGEGVHEKLLEVQVPLSNVEREQIENEVSAKLYYGFYTPTRPTSTLEDFYTTRVTLLSWFVTKFHYNRYIEIGTANNVLFEPMTYFVIPENDINKQGYTVGVDPESGGTVRATSDEFFRNNTMIFDIVFVDGLHEANQAFRDIRNSLRVLAPGGTILVHDCNPRGPPSMSSFPRDENAYQWTGDTWKAIVAMRLDPNVDLVVVDVDMGIAVIRKGPNRHPLPQEWLDILSVNPISMLEYSHIANHREELLPMVSVAEMREWINLQL